MTIRERWQSRDARRLGCALALGLIYAAFVTLGAEIRQNGAFLSSGWALAGRFALLSVLFAAAVWALFGLMKKQNEREAKRESLFGRVTGNGFFVFFWLLLCWIPVWLAFWPGDFSADSLTQFESYYNGEPYAHHPLLHTALLGACMMLGIDLHPEGYATYGLAIYCGVQMVLLAACVAYACHWMKRRGVPVWARTAVTLLLGLGPFYAPWPFCAQKDVLFAALAMLLCLQFADLWQLGLKPLRVIGFSVIALLMMFMRNNGVYAFLLLLPFAVGWARRGSRVRMAILMAVCAAVYLAGNNAVIEAIEAERGSKVEMLSIPLQQMARTLRDHPESAELDEDGVLETLYGDTQLAEIYHPQIADPVKWAVDYDALEETLPDLLSLWAQMGLRYPLSYLEAFLEQNLPYFLPYSDMLYHFDLTVKQIEWFPIEQHSYLPKLRSVYEQYDETLSFLGIPGTRLLSDTAFFVWLCLFGFAYAVYRREYGLMTAFGFLIAVWLTCLLGPVAIMRYLLSLFYAVPVLLARLLTPRRKPC